MTFERPKNKINRKRSSPQTPKSIVLTWKSSDSESSGVIIASLSGVGLADFSLPALMSCSCVLLDREVRTDVFSMYLETTASELSSSNSIFEGFRSVFLISNHQQIPHVRQNLPKFKGPTTCMYDAAFSV